MRLNFPTNFIFCFIFNYIMYSIRLITNFIFSLINLSILSWLYSPLLGLGLFFSFLIYTQSVGYLERGISLSQSLYLDTEQHKQKKTQQTSMPGVRFEPTTPLFEQAKTVHTLDRVATVTGSEIFIYS
jgi:hypothetical protein